MNKKQTAPAANQTAVKAPKSKSLKDCKSAKEVAEYYKRTGEEIKDVKFNNGRVFNNGSSGTRPPIVMSGVKDPRTNLSIRFDTLKIYDMNGDAIESVIDGKVIPRTFGDAIKFTASASASFNPISHFEVIDLIRKSKDCVTPNKPYGYDPVKTGKIIEYAPGALKAKEVKAFEIATKADRVRLALMDDGNKTTLNFALALLGIVSGDLIDKKMELSKYVNSNAQSFLELFKDTNSESPELRANEINRSIVKMALANNVIEYKNDGQYYVGDSNLGTNSEKISKNYSQHIGTLRSELNRLGLIE